MVLFLPGSPCPWPVWAALALATYLYENMRRSSGARGVGAFSFLGSRPMRGYRISRERAGAEAGAGAMAVRSTGTGTIGVDVDEKSRSEAVLADRAAQVETVLAAWNEAVRRLDNARRHQESVRRRRDGLVTRMSRITPHMAPHQVGPTQEPVFRGFLVKNPQAAARSLACQPRIDQALVELAPELEAASVEVGKAELAMRIATRRLLAAVQPADVAPLTGRPYRSLLSLVRSH